MRLTKRGELVFGILLVIVGIQALALAVWALDHVNYIQGVGYCFKSSLECYGLKG